MQIAHLETAGFIEIALAQLSLLVGHTKPIGSFAFTSLQSQFPEYKSHWGQG
jgi:hypothetical protein